MSAITSEPFGKTKECKDVYLYTLKTGKVTVRVINIGCIIKDILLPDKDGNIVDVALGYDTLEDYMTNPSFYGCLCGRVVNRIADGKFTLDGVKYNVSKNDPLADNICHGGFVGLSRRYFDGKIDGSKLVMAYVDVDGAEGFPGDVTLTVTFELTEKDGLMVDYNATTNKPTPIDLSYHILSNLAGHNAGTIYDHVITIDSSQKLECDAKFIPTGNLINTEGTVMDFRKPTLLADVIDKQPAGDGIHHALVLNGEKGKSKCVGRVEHPASKRHMEVYSTEPVVVAYSGFYIAKLLNGKQCKDGHVYQASSGIVFMPHGYPDAVNHPKFPSCILRPGETYRSTTWYKFGVAQ